MPGEIVHIEIPADDTGKAQEFWGSLLGWEFQAFPGPFEYHMARLSEQQGAAITNMEQGKKGMRAYFLVDEINAGAARVRSSAAKPTTRARSRRWDGSQPARTPTGKRVRTLAERHVRTDSRGVGAGLPI